MASPARKLKAPKLVIAPGTPAAVGGVVPTTTDPLLLFPEGEVKFKDRDFQFIEELGAGSGGSVSKVLHKPTNSIMARKNISVNVDDENDRKRAEKHLKAELKILHICRSEYIVSSFGAFSHDGCVSICMEYMDLGSLDGIYKRFGPIPEPVGVRIAVHVLRGLVYLTEKSIVHRGALGFFLFFTSVEAFFCGSFLISYTAFIFITVALISAKPVVPPSLDIKPSNILINTRGQVKIADFGVSKEVVNTKARTFTGTQGYLAPERIQSGQDYSVVSDIWSLGLSLIEISTGRFPYPPEGHPPMSLFDLISYIGEKPPPTLPPGRFSREFEDLVAHSTLKDPAQRPGPEALLQHPYLLRVVNDGIDLSEWAQHIASKYEN
ncbi:Dual specificity mitogen-activated protein kinase kinase 1 [Dinochytrium kinnereticum]|nr:Dual specificity mitogen-activated protein kinase kinase 1 [Dinochytrium kinnereticum]